MNIIQNQIEIINEQIKYNDGKIFFELNKGYTSNTMKYLYQCGYRAATSGVIHTLYDSDNKAVCKAYSWLGLLQETAKVMA